MDGSLEALRSAAKTGRDPTCADETLALLLSLGSGKRVLEIGAGEGLTSVALAFAGASVVAVERNAERCAKAREHAARFGAEKIRLIEGDATQVLPEMAGEFDLIFLDCAKVQYRRLFPDCKRLLAAGGTLVSDDVLLYGWVRGEAPKKRRMLVEHMRAFLELLGSDPELETTIYEYGEGVAVSKRI